MGRILSAGYTLSPMHGTDLSSEAQSGNPHALKLGIGPQSGGDERVVLDGVVVQAGQVRLVHLTALPVLVPAGDQVVAVVQLIIGMPSSGTEVGL